MTSTPRPHRCAKLRRTGHFKSFAKQKERDLALREALLKGDASPHRFDAISPACIPNLLKHLAAIR
jgi:hypothetical protein